MDHAPTAPPWVYLVALAFIALAVTRNARARNLRVERLWIGPAVILAMTLLAFSQQTVPSVGMVALDLLALGVGAALGWWRGRFTRIAVDPQTHALTSQTSPLGMLLILAIFALRSVVRAYATAHAGSLHVSITGITDAFLLLAVGVVCAQRLEMALRASRLLAEARAATR